MLKKSVYIIKLCCCLAAMSLCSLAFGQELNSNQIKTAYLYNFIKHVNWPNESEKQNYLIGVYKDKAFAKLLEQTFANRKIKNKPIKIINILLAREAKTSDVLFVPQVSTSQISDIAAAVRGSQTLLVSDNSIDKYSVMINLVFDEKNAALSFEVNKSNLVFEQLNISDELLLLGGTELDVAMLYREIEMAMQNTLQRERQLNQTLENLQLKLSNSLTQLNQLDVDLAKKNSELDNQQKELMTLKKQVQQQQTSLENKEQQILLSSNKLSTIERELFNKEQSILAKALENTQMANRINENKDILVRQQRHIEDQKQSIEQQDIALTKRDETIIQQKNYLLFTFVFIIAISCVAILIVYLFIKNKKSTRKLSNALSNLEEAQEQLIQSEKLASLGTLTAGVAHEINTPLGVSVTSTSALLEKTRLIEEKFEQGAITKTYMKKYFGHVYDALKLNENSLERVIDLLQNFKQVAADQIVEESRSIVLSNYINEVVSTLSVELKRNNVNFISNVIAEIRIETIPGALAQVITNLVTNSIKHGFEGKNDGEITIHLVEKNNKAIITYRDNGIGMAAEVLKNIYEPFFTTKRNQGGTGLGMNIVYNVINQKLCGEIQIVSEENKGVLITITLPLALPN